MLEVDGGGELGGQFEAVEGEGLDIIVRHLIYNFGITCQAPSIIRLLLPFIQFAELIVDLGTGNLWNEYLVVRWVAFGTQYNALVVQTEKAARVVVYFYFV